MCIIDFVSRFIFMVLASVSGPYMEAFASRHHPRRPQIPKPRCETIKRKPLAKSRRLASKYNLYYINNFFDFTDE